MVGVSCMGAKSLEGLGGREKPSMKEGAKFSGSQRGFNMPDRGAGLLANAESSSAISWCRSSIHLGGTSLNGVLLFGIAGEESWESLSANFRMVLMTALTVGEGALAFLSKRGACGWKAAAVGGAATERTPKYPPWVRWGSGALF